MKERCAHIGALSLTRRFDLEICGSISLERLVSVDANFRRDGFLPPHHSFTVSAFRLPPQNAAYYTTIQSNCGTMISSVRNKNFQR